MGTRSSSAGSFPSLTSWADIGGRTSWAAAHRIARPRSLPAVCRNNLGADLRTRAYLLSPDITGSRYDRLSRWWRRGWRGWGRLNHRGSLGGRRRGRRRGGRRGGCCRSWGSRWGSRRRGSCRSVLSLPPHANSPRDKTNKTTMIPIVLRLFMGTYPFWILKPNRLAELQPDTVLHDARRDRWRHYTQSRGFVNSFIVRGRYGLLKQSISLTRR